MIKKKIKNLTYNDICSLCSNYPYCAGCPLSFNHVCNGFDREENGPKLIFTTDEKILETEVSIYKENDECHAKVLSDETEKSLDRYYKGTKDYLL